MTGKSQALNTWLKEFMYNVLIQPFHCIIYMVFSTLIITLLESPTNSLGSGLLVIIIMIFMKQAETIIRTIFGFGNAKSLGDVVAAGALVAGSVSAASKTLGALNRARGSSSGGNKGGNSSSGGADKKPNLKDTSNAGGAQKQTNASGGSNGQTSNSNNTGGSNSSSGGNDSGSNRGGSNNSDNTSSGSSNSSTNSSSGNSVDTVSTEDRSYNTEAVKNAESKFKNVLSKYASLNVKALEIAAGIGIGGAMGGDIPSMIAGGNFAKAGINATKLGGELVISGFKKTPIAKNSRINQKTDKVMDAYNNLKAEKGWSDDRMLDETERVLDIKDTSTIKNEKLREYAETVQDLRKEYEEDYKVPNDMVLDRISKVQSGQVKRSSKKYTKKPKTRPIDRRSRRQKQNGNRQNGN